MHDEYHSDSWYREPCSLAEEAAMTGACARTSSAGHSRFRARQGTADRQLVVIEKREAGWRDDEGNPRYDAVTLPLAEAEDFLRELQAVVNAARDVRADRWWSS